MLGLYLYNGGAGNDIGTMTSGYDNVEIENYYQWTTTQTSAQQYDILVSIPIPSDYASSPAFTFDVNLSSTSTASLTATLVDSNGTADPNWTSCNLSPVSTGWDIGESGCTVTAANNSANGDMILTLIPSASDPGTAGTVEMGNITFSYTSAF